MTTISRFTSHHTSNTQRSTTNGCIVTTDSVFPYLSSAVHPENSSNSIESISVNFNPPNKPCNGYNQNMDKGHIFQKSELERILSDCIDKTLSEVDSKHVLASKKANKGYPGMVIEQSVLNYPADNARRPDLVVDGVETELKTTGIIKSKKHGIKYEAKEPVSITAVRPKYIVNEEFEKSGFWEKTAHMLLVYYQYTHKASANAPLTYGDFPIRGFEFKAIDGETKEALEKDWTIVRDFIRQIQHDYPDKPESQYPRISSDLNRQRLTSIDTAPKWPNPPRFRFKRRFVSTLVQEYFGKKFDKLPDTYTSFEEIDAKCHELTQKYSGKTISELFDIFNIKTGKAPSKEDAERVVVKMFGGTASKINKVEMFNKYSIIGKTVVITKKGYRTEDMKLDSIDFEEVQKQSVTFEESSFKTIFSDPQYLCIIFEEPSHDAPFAENKFLGFKRCFFDDSFIENEVQPIWESMRKLIFDHTLKNVPQLTSKGEKRYNKNGTLREAPNWPKSKDGIVFLRGSGRDSSDKIVNINGVQMYRQNIWVKGTYIVRKLEELPYL